MYNEQREYTTQGKILTSRPGWKPGKACWNLANLWRSLDALTLGYPAPVGRTYSRRSRKAWKRNVALSYTKTSGQNNRCNLPWRSEYPFQDELVQSPAQVKDHFVSSVQKVHSSRVDAFVAQLWNKGKHGWNHCDLSSGLPISFEPVISVVEGWRSPGQQDLQCLQCRWAHRPGTDPDKYIGPAVD